jgi:hypothetical protein
MLARRSTPRRQQPTTQEFQPVMEDRVYYYETVGYPRDNYRLRDADGIRVTFAQRSMGIVPNHLTLPEHLHHSSALWPIHVRNLLEQHIDVLRYQGPDGIIAYGYVTTPEDFVKLLHNYGIINFDETPYVDRNWDIDTKAGHYIQYWINWYRRQEDLLRRPMTQQQDIIDPDPEEENYFAERLAQLDRNHDTRLRLRGLLQDEANELEQEQLAVLENSQMLPNQERITQERALLREYENERNEFLILAAQQPEPIDYIETIARMESENTRLNFLDDQIRLQRRRLRRLFPETTEPSVRLSPGSPEPSPRRRRLR